MRGTRLCRLASYNTRDAIYGYNEECLGLKTRIVYDLESSSSDEFDVETLIVECETEENEARSIANQNDRHERKNFDEIQPYMYEPECSDSEGGENANTEREQQAVVERNPEEIQLRTQSLNWCQCGHCQILPTYRECRCCAEITAVQRRLEEGVTMYSMTGLLTIVLQNTMDLLRLA
ncbi:uncharacterized protein LOC117124882 [Anneissia japonica]|uniref:uncharacterized protein LOC117124882 n=1 Tax=Anneissia japonica TaxID=1529436 RepID=UPI001425A371|nr:uncharacterized protein LOC117124882 [Anneissia japonica]